ncbi:ATP-binding protein, partial [Streptomyces tendae]
EIDVRVEEEGEAGREDVHVQAAAEPQLHVPERAAHVGFTYADSRLLITVSNDGPATATAVDGTSGGFGLRGMRERAQSIGGDLCAGPRPEGGFEVTTALPLQPSAAVEGESP